MKEQLQLVIDLATNDAVRNVQALRKASGQLEGDLDDTRTAAQQVADAIDAATDQLVDDLQASERATAALAQALGPDLAAKIGQGGIDEFIADLKRAGLTFQDIEGDADRFAQSLKRIDEVTPKVAQLDGELNKVRATTDNSRSVMANFTGNALQELPGVSSAMGPLNVALGQFAEYAVDGNIKLGSFLKTAGGIGAAAVALGLLAEAASLSSRKQAELDERSGQVADTLDGIVEQSVEFEQATVDLSDSSAVLSQALLDSGDSGEKLRQALGALETSGDQAFDVLDDLNNGPWDETFRGLAESAGVAQGDISDLIQAAVGVYGPEESDAMDAVAEKYRTVFDAMQDIAAVRQDFDLSGIATEFLNAQVSAGGAQAELVRTAEALKGVTREGDPVAVARAFIELAGGINETKRATEEYQEKVALAKRTQELFADALVESINQHRRLVGQLWGVERATIATEDAYADLTTQQSEWGDGVGDNADELRDLRDAQIGVAEQVVDLTLKELEAQGINADSVEGAQAQIDKLKVLQEKYPLVADELQKYIDALYRVPGTVNTNLTINGRPVGANEVTGPGGTSMTPTNPGEPPKAGDSLGADSVTGTTPTDPPKDGESLSGRRGEGNVTIIVQGAIDPVSVARQVRDLLNDDATLRGVGLPL